MAYMPDPFTYHTERPRLLYVATVSRRNIGKPHTKGRRVLLNDYHVTKGHRRHPSAYDLFLERYAARQLAGG